MAHMPIFGHTFLGHNSAIFEPVGLKFFMGDYYINHYLSIGHEKSKL